MVFALALLAFSWGCARRGALTSPEDAGEPSGYRLVTSFAIEGYAEDVFVSGDLALVAASQGGLVILDVSDPTAPSHLGTAPTVFKGTGCAYAPSDSFGYVTDGSLGCVAFDLSDPTAPEEVTYVAGTRTWDIAVVETAPGELHHIFGADGEGDFRIWELEYFAAYDAWYSTQIYHGNTTGSARGICLHEDMALLAMEELGLSIFDVSSLQSPYELGHVDTPGEARAVATDGDYAYVADWRAGLQVVDITDPSSPVLVGEYDTDDISDGVFYRDGLVYLADHNGGLKVFDVSDPTLPVLVGQLDTPYANAVFVTDEYVYVADRDWGLIVAEEE
ncbi:MAG: hypothetical protein GF400_02325 [Candidatus Eisenbacteria bacterium]|nr:hypothetical protein [Candidatus Eisenbacteria bacterium]